MTAKSVTVLLHTAIEGEEPVLASYPALLRTEGEERLISYTEEQEGVRTATLLTVRKDGMTLVRRGGVSFSAEYRAGLSHDSFYSLGGMKLAARTDTCHYSATLGGDTVELSCVYDLTLGGEQRRFSLSLRTLPEGVKA